MECIFGIDWTVAQIRPWILDSVELFGPNRCMFASHLPICKLACSVQQLYAAYLEAIAGFSVSEKRQMLHDTAAEIYGLWRSARNFIGRQHLLARADAMIEWNSAECPHGVLKPITDFSGQPRRFASAAPQGIPIANPSAAAHTAKAISAWASHIGRFSTEA
jgi:hypothetical protein